MKNGQTNFYLISLASMVAFLLLQFIDPPVIRDHIESKTYDLRLHLRNALQKQPLQQDIVIVAIDEDSLAKVGRWPWSRHVMARLVEKIGAGGPKAIGIDILFSEREDPEADRALAGAVEKAGNVVLATAFFLDPDNERPAPSTGLSGILWDSAFMEVKAIPGIDWKRFAKKSTKVVAPIEEIARGGILGHVTALTDLDGTIRSELLSLNYGDDCYPSLALQVARTALGVPMKDMSLFGGSAVRIADQTIPTGLSSQVEINYRGGEKSFPHLSAAEVLEGAIQSDAFHDKIVLIGTSALATYDHKVTPFSANLPGVEKNANVVQNLLLNNFIRRSPGVVELASIMAASLALILLLPRFSAVKGVILGSGMIGLYFVLSNVLLFYLNLRINLVYPVANMMLILATQTTTKLFTEEKRARQIRDIFSSYVSPKIVELLVNKPEKAAMAGERKTVTVMFCDIIGFTTLSERLPPEEVVAMLNEYFKEMAETIFQWDGTLDKFVGDEIMAIWGAPIDQPDQAELATRCALQMSDRLDRLQAKWRDEGKRNIDCGIGINSGEVVIGNIGWLGKKMDYTAIGNNVNIAARIEKLTRQYGTRILITDNTYEMIKHLVDSGSMKQAEFTRLDSVKVKGKDEKVRIFSVRSLGEGAVLHDAV